MVTVKDLENLTRIEKAQELRRQGYPPEQALFLAGVEPGPELGGSRHRFTREEANLIFDKDDLATKKAKARIARERRAWKLRRVGKFIQFVITIVLAIAVARVWRLF